MPGTLLVAIHTVDCLGIVWRVVNDNSGRSLLVSSVELLLSISEQRVSAESFVYVFLADWKTVWQALQEQNPHRTSFKLNLNI